MLQLIMVVIAIAPSHSHIIVVGTKAAMRGAWDETVREERAVVHDIT